MAEMEEKEMLGMIFWRPVEINDELSGEIVEKREGDFGMQYVIRNTNGMFLTPSHKVLQARLLEAKVGQKIKIVFTATEKAEKKGNKDTKIYRVYLVD